MRTIRWAVLLLLAATLALACEPQNTDDQSPCNLDSECAADEYCKLVIAAQKPAAPKADEGEAEEGFGDFDGGGASGFDSNGGGTENNSSTGSNGKSGVCSPLSERAGSE